MSMPWPRSSSAARRAIRSRFVFEVPQGYEVALVAPKGSVALDGVSLTVNEVEGAALRRQHHSAYPGETTFGTAEVGDRVNLEIDLIARYMARILGRTLA